ncbi:amino acid permease [Candidatus Acidianus copahuensis]|uniref:Amino acid permease n=1 Tax=Candidatus Acidianus copahuensis TaxID=1160895 RepID=A0A031LL78_9CREN|nr:APC family permease [Candidatus Acidianus copahuensis]EZQ02409.1 amino acid permease [Candidatus Acidianus copahuensis]
MSVEKGKKSIEQKRKNMTYTDLFFLSFGGQAPFISLLTFGTVMIEDVHQAAPFAMIIATIVVLFNGLVVNFMSRRFKKGGGYYIYAIYSLTDRLGLETGWSYLLYALAYGGTLIAGGAYVLHYITGLDDVYAALLVSSLGTSIVIAGIKISTKYAIVMSSIEMITLVALGVFFLHQSGWHFYNPISFPPGLLDAVIFGLGIPTGYGSIAPLGDEASSKAIGKAAISVLLFGGALATFFFYSLGSLNFSGNLIEYLLTNFGLIGGIFISFISLSDGTLGGISYILADSRTLKAMAKDGKFPNFLAREWHNKPIFSEIIIGSIFILVITLLADLMGTFGTFVLLGGLAGVMNLVIHFSADISLIKVTSKRSRKRWTELIIGVIALIISFFVLIYSFLPPGLGITTTDIFFIWIIMGFLYAEALAMSKGAEEEG